MKTIDHDQYLTLREQAAVLEADGHGDKVLRLQDGRILKLFRRKRLLSSALWSPYAQRFVRNAKRLSSRGILTPVIDDYFRIPCIQRDAVLYQPIVGETLRHLFRAHPNPANLDWLRTEIARLIRHLHQSGIYFRSMHLGNIILTPDQQLGLIDFSDLQLYPFPLPRSLRIRNLSRIARICAPGESDWIDQTAILRPSSTV